MQKKHGGQRAGAGRKRTKGDRITTSIRLDIENYRRLTEFENISDTVNQALNAFWETFEEKLE